MKPQIGSEVNCEFLFCEFLFSYKNSQLTSLPICGFIAQLVEHRTGIAEVTGSNPVEAMIFFQASSFQLLQLEIHCDDHLSPS